MESRVLGWASALAVALASGVTAQNGPAEIPPASYAGNQYVDSAGCAFVRAGVSGQVTWVARLNGDRQPLCGFRPTLSGLVDAAPPAAPDTVADPAPDPVPAAAPAPVPDRPAMGAPIETVASLTTAPVLAPVAPRSPAIVAPPPAPVAAPATVPPALRTITLAEACAGRTGVQPNMISARTGQPIDCGPGPQAAVAAAPVAPAAGIAPGVAPQVVPVPVAVLPRSINLCAPGILVGGSGYETRCAGSAVPSAPAGAVAPMAPGLTAPPGQVVATGTLAALCDRARRTGARLVTADGSEVRCVGTGAGAPLGMTGGTGYGVGQTVGGGLVRRSAATPAPGELFPAPAIPASNPAYAPAVVAPPPGYGPVWDDGRLNPHRGLPPGTIVTQGATVPPGTVVIATSG